VIRLAAQAVLNQAADAERLLAEYAAAIGISVSEAADRVREYLDDCLSQ
jgi:hypothetical protein